MKNKAEKYNEVSNSSDDYAIFPNANGIYERYHALRSEDPYKNKRQKFLLSYDRKSWLRGGKGPAKDKQDPNFGQFRSRIDSAEHFLTSSSNLYDIGSSGGFKPKNIFAAGYVAADSLVITDGIPALSASAITGSARIYVDSADGDLKVIFGDGTIKTIVTDT